MKVELVNEEFFKSAKSRQLAIMDGVKVSEAQIEMTIPPIIPDSDLGSLESLQNAAGRMQAGVITALTTNLIIQTLINGSLDQIWGLIRAMKLIILSSLVDVPFPATAYFFFKICIDIQMLDLF